MGIADTVGHALTFMILVEDTQRILFRSVVCTATNPSSRNLRARGYPNQDPPVVVHSSIDDSIAEMEDGETPRAIKIPIIHPEDLVGRVFEVQEEEVSLLLPLLVDV